MKKPLSRWTKIVLWTVFGFSAFCLIAFGLLLFIAIAPELTLEEISNPKILYIIIYSALLLAWFVFRKNKSLVKFIQDAIPFLFIGEVLYFWSTASNWENNLQEDWARYPALSNASATLEYVKALVKTVMFGGIAIIVMLYFKNNFDSNTVRDSKSQSNNIAPK